MPGESSLLLVVAGRLPAVQKTSNSVIVLVIVALLLQPGMGDAMPVMNQAAHPAGAAVTLQHHEPAGNECSTGACSPQQCDMGAGISCHCFCIPFPLQTVDELTFVASASALAVVENSPGSAPRRPDRPFRPPP